MRTKTKHAFTLLAAVSLPAALAVAAAGGNVAEQAKRSIDQVEASAEGKKLAAEPLKNAKGALERASDARATGDKQHAPLLDALALEWAESAADLTRTAALEQKAADVEAKAAELDAKSVRALAIIEEALARRGRAELELSEQEASAKTPAPPAQEKPAQGQKPPPQKPAPQKPAQGQQPAVGTQQKKPADEAQEQKQ